MRSCTSSAHQRGRRVASCGIVPVTRQAVTDLDLGSALDGLFEGACHLDGLGAGVRRDTQSGTQCAVREDVVQRQVVKKARRLVGSEIGGQWSRLG